jgi:hypothetical protein
MRAVSPTHAVGPERYPAGHGSHAVDPSSAAKKKSSHGEHEPCPRSGWIVPGAHFAQFAIPALGAALPAAQISQDDIPRDLAALPTAHGVHALASVSAEKVPVAHVSHVETPPTETTAVPGGHSVSIAVESTVNPAERLDTGSPIAAFSSLVTRAVSVTFHAPPSATGYKSGVST